MPYGYFQFEVKDSVGIIRMNRPPSNAIHPGWIREFSELIPSLATQDEVRCVIVTSALEKIFMAGADISYLQEMHQAIATGKEKVASGTKVENPLQATFSHVEALPKPVIACINGHALGGGCELALACHYRFMASDYGTIGLTEVNLGILPAAGGTQRMIRVLGKAKALPLLLEGKRLKPEEAKELGLVHALYPKKDLFEASMELARRLAQQPPIAIASILRCVREGAQVSIEKGLEIETEEFVRLIQTEDAMEGFQAFFEKRPARFRGK